MLNPIGLIYENNNTPIGRYAYKWCYKLEFSTAFLTKVFT